MDRRTCGRPSGIGTQLSSDEGRGRSLAIKYPWRRIALWAILLPRVVAGADPQIGVNDFRISDMGGAGSQLGVTGRPAVAQDSIDRGYLAVWQGQDIVPGLNEIYGRLLDAAGVPLGADAFKISDHSQGNISFWADSPSVAFNPDLREYLVVWAGRDFFLGANGTEILGQRLSQDGSFLGGMFRISDMGDETSLFDGYGAKVVYNGVHQEYLVVWYGDDNEDGMVDNEYEVFGQRLDGLGNELGIDFRISQMGPNGVTTADGFDPDVAFAPIPQWYLVVWYGDPGTGALVDQEYEVFGQVLDAEGNEIGSNDFLVSEMGGIGDAAFDAVFPEVSFDPESRHWLVAWTGDDDENGHVDDEFEVYGQFLNESGSAVGSDDFQISFTGANGNTAFLAADPDIAFDALVSRFLVTWEANPLLELEVYATTVEFTTGVATARPYRLSDMGPEGDVAFFGSTPKVTQDPFDGQFLVVWIGSDDEGGHVATETDIFGQRISFPFFADGFESGDTGSWN